MLNVFNFCRVKYLESRTIVRTLFEKDKNIKNLVVGFNIQFLFCDKLW